MSRPKSLLATVGLALCAALVTGCGESESQGQRSTATPSERSPFTFKVDPGTRVATGVSTFAYHMPSGETLLYVTDGGVKIYRSENGLKFTDTGKSVNGAFDPTVVALPSGTLRMYVASPIGQPGANPGQQRKELRSYTSDNGLDWTLEPGVRQSDVGFGVPDVVPISDGQWRLYWCSRNSDDKTQIAAANSTAGGLGFKPTKLTGLPVGYVDPSVVQLGDGSWLAALSTNPRELGSRETQKVYLATSKDGLRWKLRSRPLISSKSNSALDPTLLKVSKNRYRIYYSWGNTTSSPPPQPGQNGMPQPPQDQPSIKSGVLTIRK